MFSLSHLFKKQAVDSNRWIVLDVETTGLDTRKAQLLEIAAVSLHLDPVTQQLKIDVADSFEAVLKQDIVLDKENILLHGIGVGAQKAGEDPAKVLKAFEQWIGTSPLFGFHVIFDEAMIQKTFRQFLGRTLTNLWIDIEPLVSRTYPQIKYRYMDDWMRHMGIECAVRHQAAADTYATAEILMQIWPQLRRSAPGVQEVHDLAKRAAKLPRH